MALSLVALGACSDDTKSASSTTTTAASSTTDGGSTTTAAGASTVVPDDAGAAATTAPVTAADVATTAPSTTTKKASKSTATTALLPASTGLPPVLSKNSQGVDIKLDETALLACAQNQIAWVALQSGSADEASAALDIAAQRAAASAVPEVKSSATTLREASTSSSPRAEVDRFLAFCVASGFEY